MDSCGKAAPAENAGIPTLLRKERAGLQWAVCVAVVGAVVTLKIPFSLTPLPDEIAGVTGVAASIGPVVAMVVGMAVFLGIFAAREALRTPKLAAQGTGTELLRTLLQLCGDILLIPFYACLPKEKPMLGYQPTPENLAIMVRCPSLLMGFSQTPWLNNALWAFAALMVADNWRIEKFRKHIRRENLTTADGGNLALDWWEYRQTCDISKGVLFVNSTFTGDALPLCVRAACQHFTARGWRCVVMVKRGCGLTMPNTQPVDNASRPAPWCLSGLSDVKLAVDHVARVCPNLPICGIGFSTGAGQLRDYVNSTGKDCKFTAAVILDAAPDWCRAIESLDKRTPLISQALGMAIAATFKECGYPEQPQACSDESTKAVKGGIFEFISDVMAPAHGYERSLDGGREYMRSCVTAHASNCRTPCLELTTTNDTLVTAEMAHIVQSSYKLSPHVVTAMSQTGTHMIRWEGWWPSCWVSRVAGEFLESVLLQERMSACTLPKTKAARARNGGMADSAQCGQGCGMQAKSASFIVADSAQCGQGLKARARTGSCSNEECIPHMSLPAH